MLYLSSFCIYISSVSSGAININNIEWVVKTDERDGDDRHAMTSLSMICYLAARPTLYSDGMTSRASTSTISKVFDYNATVKDPSIPRSDHNICC